MYLHYVLDRWFTQDTQLLDKSYRVLRYDSLEEYEQTVFGMSKALKDNPRDGVACNNRGVAFWVVGQVDDALRDFTMAIACRPDDPVPFANRGQLHEKQGRMKEAVADFGCVITNADDKPTYHRCRAFARMRMGAVHKAIEDFTNAIELARRNAASGGCGLMARWPRLGGGEVVRAFESLGWENIRQSNSHIMVVREGH